MAVIEMVSVRFCLRCGRRALHVFMPSRGGGSWACDRCPGMEVPVRTLAEVVEQDGVAA